MIAVELSIVRRIGDYPRQAFTKVNNLLLCLKGGHIRNAEPI